MALNSIKFMLALTLATGVAFANDQIIDEMNEDYLTVKSVTVTRVKTDAFNQEVSEVLTEHGIEQYSVRDLPGVPNKSGQAPTANVGKILAIGKDLVALGESIYSLVQKGKPSNKTTYAPISILPRVNGQNVDIFDTENWKMPAKATYVITYKNLYGMEVVKFRYSIIFSYGGTYNGTGAYITAAQIVPESVNTSFGYDFSATMKMGGMSNLGTKANPLAGVILSMQYTVETVMQANLETASYHVTGKGGFKAL